jgi:hypothetical protein
MRFPSLTTYLCKHGVSDKVDGLPREAVMGGMHLDPTFGHRGDGKGITYLDNKGRTTTSSCNYYVGAMSVK